MRAANEMGMPNRTMAKRKACNSLSPMMKLVEERTLSFSVLVDLNKRLTY